MPSHGIKELLENIKDKFRSVFSPQDPQKRKNALPPKAHFSIWYFLIAIFLFTYLQQYFLSAKVDTISYSQFKQYIAEGNVGKLAIGPENINGTLKGEPVHWMDWRSVLHPSEIPSNRDRRIYWATKP